MALFGNAGVQPGQPMLPQQGGGGILGYGQPTIGSSLLGTSPTDYNTLGASLKDAIAYFSGRPEQANSLMPAIQQGQEYAQQQQAASQIPLLLQAAQSGDKDALSKALGNPYLARMFGPSLITNAINQRQKAVHTLAPSEYGQYGIDPTSIPPGALIQTDANGGIHVIKTGDMKSPGAIQQQIDLKNADPMLGIALGNLGVAKERLAVDKNKLQIENPFAGGQNTMGPDAFKNATPAVQSTVKAMIEGRMAPPSSMALAKPYWQNMLALANSVDPNFDQTAWHARNNARKDFTGGGKSYQMLNSGNTVIQHLGRLNNQIGDVASSALPMWNRVENFGANELGVPGVNAYNDTLGHLSEETTKFYRGTGGNEDDIKRTMKNLSPNLSAAQKQSGVANTVHLIYGKLQPMVEQYNKTMGTSFPPSHFLSKEAINTMRSMGYDPDTGEKTSTSSSGGGKVIKWEDMH